MIRETITCCNNVTYVGSFEAATGLDGMPAWYLRLMAPIVAAPFAALFNQSILAGVVPRQWKDAIITPVPKVPVPVEEADYRPISVTSVLSRQVERHIA